MLDDARIATIEAAIAAQEAHGQDWSNLSVYDAVGGNYASLSQYLKARRARARHPARSGRAAEAVAVEDALPTATDAYVECASALQEQEGKLAALTARQASGERLGYDETISKYVLSEGIEQLRREVATLRAPMEAEVLALDIADVVEVGASWVDPHVQAFQQWVQAVAALWTARQHILEVHQAHARAMHAMPAYQNLGLEMVPTGEESFRNLLSRMPDAAAWMQIFLSPHSTPLTAAQARAMAEVYPTLRPPQVGPLTRQVQAQRRSR